MKEKKFFKLAKYIDEELIGEAAEYTPSQNKDEGEPVYVSAVRTKSRKGQLWKYPAAAAALLAVMVGSVFAFNYVSRLKNDLGPPSQTDNTKTITPLKIECLYENDEEHFKYPAAVYVDSDPVIPYQSFDEEYFTEMTTEELIDYYDCYMFLKVWLEEDELTEITDENTHHGIYKLPDGSIYDLNTFIFERKEKTTYYANRFTVTIGKWTRFGQEYVDFFRECTNGELCNGSDYAALYNEETDSVFSIYKSFGVSIMVSGTVDEITGSFYAGDPNTTAYGDYYGYNQDKSKALICADLLSSTTNMVWGISGSGNYFDDNVKLWYREDNDSYLNEETFEWVSKDDIIDGNHPSGIKFPVIDEGADFSALELLGLVINENETKVESRYVIPNSEWEELDDFDLFREIFFGWWGHGTMDYGDYGEMFIDDSVKCHYYFQGLRFVGFYRVSENVYSFYLTSLGGLDVYWVDRTNPDIIYREWLMPGLGDGFCFVQWKDMKNYKTQYALRVGDVDSGAEDDGFISVFKLHELAQKYDISYDRLVNTQMSNSDNSYVIEHTDLYAFHKMYLISESENKIVLETALSDFWGKSEMLIPVVCTFEKIDGEWVKNVEIKDMGLKYHKK